MDMISTGPIHHTIIVSALYLYFLSEWSGLVDTTHPFSRLI
ncbi:MAG TPA: hypothetical protein PLD91_13185 [Spirochaetota bacterium]|nr:hypothetical protein [Spirochaetota bacterium]